MAKQYGLSSESDDELTKGIIKWSDLTAYHIKIPTINSQGFLHVYGFLTVKYQ